MNLERGVGVGGGVEFSFVVFHLVSLFFFLFFFVSLVLLSLPSPSSYRVYGFL